MAEHKQRCHEILLTLVRTEWRKQLQRYTTLRKYVAIYEYGAKGADRHNFKEGYLNDAALTYNPAQNAVDTLVAQICTPRVVPMAITEGGTWTQQDRAEKLTRCLQGQFDELDFDVMKEMAIRDSALMGIGVLHTGIDWDKGCITAERVYPLDLLFDDSECRDGKPRCMYRRWIVDRYVADELFGGPAGENTRHLVGSAKKRSAAILDAPKPQAVDTFDIESSEHLIEIWEAWHLPSRAPDPTNDDDKGSGDGVHALVIDGQTLVYEPWNEDSFPFAFYIPKRARTGIWGIPLMRQLAAGQREFEKLTLKMQEAHRLMGGSFILANKSANIEARKFNNGQGYVLEWTGNIPPQEWTPGACNPQTYQYADSIPEKMLRFCGISALSAQSQIPAGLQQASGKALQTFEDAENRRFIEWHRELERFVLSFGDLLVRAAKRLVDSDVDVQARYREANGFEPISWKDVLLDQKSYTLRVYPVNMLAQTPSAKLEQLQTWVNMQAISVQEFRKLSGIPDLQASTDLALSDEDIIHKNLDRMVDKGVYLQPEPFDNLQAILSIGPKFYNLARLHGVSEERLALVRQYVTDAKTLMDTKAEEERQKQAQMAPPPEAGPPMPPGPPGPGMGMPPPDALMAETNPEAMPDMFGSAPMAA